MILLILAALLSFVITGCKSNEQIEIEDTDDTQMVETQEPANTPNNTNDKYSDFATDNAGNGSVQYDSGIYADDVELSEPYDYTGKVYEQTEITDDELSSEDTTSSDSDNADAIIDETNSSEAIVEMTEIEQIELKLSTYYDESGELVIAPIKGESLEDAKTRIESEIATLEERLKQLKDEELKAQSSADISELIDTVSNITVNGVFAICGVSDETSYNSEHLISLTNIVNQIKGNLEYIEYCDDIVQSRLSDKSDIITLWESIKPKLVELRNDLAEVKTGSDWINSNVESKIDYQSDTAKFLTKLNAINIA